MIVTSQATLRSRRAAASPANPPPMMITWGRRAISSILEVHAQAWCRASGIHRHDRLPARLSRCVHAGCHGARRPRHEDRRLEREPHHQRLHLRQGAPLPRARLRRRSHALSGRPARRERRGTVQARDVGRCARSDRGEVRRRRATAAARKRSCRSATAARTASSRRTTPTRSCSAASARRGCCARCARRRPARRISASTARWRRSATRTIPTRR